MVAQGESALGAQHLVKGRLGLHGGGDIPQRVDEPPAELLAGVGGGLEGIALFLNVPG